MALGREYVTLPALAIVSHEVVPPSPLWARQGLPAGSFCPSLANVESTHFRHPGGWHGFCQNASERLRI